MNILKKNHHLLSLQILKPLKICIDYDSARRESGWESGSGAKSGWDSRTNIKDMLLAVMVMNYYVFMICVYWKM